MKMDWGGRMTQRPLFPGSTKALISSTIFAIVLLSVAIIADASSANKRDILYEDIEEEDGDDTEDWDFFGKFEKSTFGSNICADTVSSDKINDDFCDCEDGSDERLTSACSHVFPNDSLQDVYGAFQCAHKAQYAPISAINDGKCDCCDGSDEPSATCLSDCDQYYASEIATLQDRIAAVHRGLDVRTNYHSAASERLSKLKDRLRERYQQMKKLEEDVESIQSLVQKNVQVMDQRDRQKMQLLYRKMQLAKFDVGMLQRLNDETVFSSADNTLDFAALEGECFTTVLKETELRGGTSNVIPETYLIRFCPFHNVTQQKVPREADKEQQQPERAVGLGIWSGWRSDVSDDTNIVKDDRGRLINRAFRSQFYAYGEPCLNDINRHVRVSVRCGDQERIVSVGENSMCSYQLIFETAAACSREYASELERSLVKMKVLYEGYANDKVNDKTSEANSEDETKHEEL